MKHRQYITYLIILVFAGLFSCANPASPSGSQYTVTLSGTVINKATTALDSVTIVVWIPFSKDTAKSNGTFSISFQAQDKSTVNDSVTFSRPGFYNLTVPFAYSSSANAINLHAVVLSGLTRAQDTLTAGHASRRAGAITYVGSSVPNLSIYGAGGADAATLTFEVKDSLGNPVDTTNQTLVYFRFATTPPDTFTQLSISSAKTNSSGTVTVQLGSGLRAGIASVQAYAPVKRAADTTKVDTIMSSVVSIPIYGGFPDSAHFSMSAAKVNIPGAVQAGIQTQITALIGDKFGNPAQPGTIVYFTTNGGIVNPAAVATGTDGTAQVNLISGNPIPAGGIVTVTAQLTTALSGSNQLAFLPGTTKSSSSDVQKLNGKNFSQKMKRLSKAEKAFNNKRTVIKFLDVANGTNHSISQSHTGGIFPEGVAQSSSKSTQKATQKSDAANNGGSAVGSSGAGIFFSSVDVVFSGNSQIFVPDTSLNVLVGGQKQFNFTVADKFGNPLSASSEVKVTTSGSGASDITLTGDVDKVIPDTKDKSFTSFTVYAKDTNAIGPSQNENFSLSILVTSPNGNVGRTLNGTLFRTGVIDTGNAATVASISLLRSSNDTIAVAGAGAIATDTLSFVVLDNNKQSVKNIPVQFFFSLGLNASEYITPPNATSDANGTVRTVVNSGVRSGLMKVAAKVLVGTATVISPDVPVYVKTGPLASIALISIDNKELSVKGVGGIENALITFEPRDALGNALDFANQTQIFFQIQGGPGSGEIVSPASRITDPFTGRVTTTLTSGTKATVLQVVAQNASATISSSPVPIVIHSGFADQAHFTVTTALSNVSAVTPPPAGVKISVVAGDKYSNPVNAGTAIYFSSTGGVIGAQGYTDGNGNASQILQIVKPIPPSGTIWVKARTVGQGGVQVSDSVSLVVSSIPVITLLGVPDTLDIFDGGFVSVPFKITDANGNPISAGNAVTVTVTGTGSSDINLTGDISAVTTRTQYSFKATDRIANGGTHGDLLFAITVTGESAPSGLTKTIPGILFAPGDIVVAPSARQPAQIAFSSITSNDIFVSGVGATENTVITYQVLDSLGQPIDKANRSYATFGLQFFQNTLTGGGTIPTLIPSADSTDDSGKLRVSIQSGTEAGVVQVIAQMQSGIKNIVSQPVRITVHAGFADQTHFTVAAAQLNFPGLDKAYVQDVVTVQVVDRYSNPVQEGTAVYFNTANGSVQTGGGDAGLTDANGFVSKILYSANPFPVAPNVLSGLTSGFSRVYARTIGKDSARVMDSIQILWTGAPIITRTGGPSPFTVLNGGTAGPFTFTVVDEFGHPMSPGTTITVAADGCNVSGDANVTMPDTQAGGAGLTNFTVVLQDAAPTTINNPLQPSALVVSVTHPVYGTYKVVIATGSVE